MKAADSCPSQCWTSTTLRPVSNRSEAQVWRKAWKPAHGTPASPAAGLRTRRLTFSYLKGSPFIDGNTKASSGGLGGRIALRSSASMNESGTVRRLVDFGALYERRPSCCPGSGSA